MPGRARSTSLWAGLALTLLLGACGSGSSPAPAMGTSSTLCALDLALTGTLAYQQRATDSVLCASTIDPGSTPTFIFLPKNKGTITSAAVSLSGVTRGALGTALGADLTLEPTSGSSVYLLGCHADLVENVLVGSEATGDRYRLRGTGTCPPDTSNITTVEGTFAFTSSAVWKN